MLKAYMTEIEVVLEDGDDEFCKIKAFDSESYEVKLNGIATGDELRAVAGILDMLQETSGLIKKRFREKGEE